MINRALVGFTAGSANEGMTIAAAITGIRSCFMWSRGLFPE
jgi:hypothetical protein